LQIDSKTIKDTESASEIEFNENDEAVERKLSKKNQEILLRRKADTVGKKGQLGEQIQNVISVGMLSEGWDAKTVTHIMGLRAFTSQLLCEQVVGRGLRRTSYELNDEGKFDPEYVQIFGVPFAFMPHEEDEDGRKRRLQKPTTVIEYVKEKAEHNFTFPVIDRIERTWRSRLILNWNKVEPLILDPKHTITATELTPMIDSKALQPMGLTEIELKELAEKYRLQTLVFKIAANIFNSGLTNKENRKDYKGDLTNFFMQIVALTEEFIQSDKIKTTLPLWDNDPLRKKVLIMLHIGEVVYHIWNEIDTDNTEVLMPVFNAEKPVRNTSEMKIWWSTKKCEVHPKSPISFTVGDSVMECIEARIINENKNVFSFVKNDHLGFYIYYRYNGVLHKYYPDFLIRKADGTIIVLETKGQKTAKDKIKWNEMKEWIAAVNNHGGFGHWAFAVSFDANDVADILQGEN
jgi:type III restriction enzyme